MESRHKGSEFGKSGLVDNSACHPEERSARRFGLGKIVDLAYQTLLANATKVASARGEYRQVSGHREVEGL